MIHKDDDWIRKEQVKHFNAVITVVEEMKNRIQILGAKNVSVYQNVLILMILIFLIQMKERRYCTIYICWRYQ